MNGAGEKLAGIAPVQAMPALALTMRTLHSTRFAVVALALQAASSLAAPPTKEHDTMAQRLQPCMVCHGKEGRATPDGYFPRIAGKPAGYLYNQLINFREGRRSNTYMTYFVENLSDAYLREIAGYFASLDLPYPPPQRALADAAALARGEALATKGDAQLRIPACTACHGQRLTGVQPAIPGLVGLPRDYLAAQLGAWQNGLRHAAAPDCMKTVADRLSPSDVGAVASWLAMQASPPGGKPDPAAQARLPLGCGGLDP